MLSRQHVQNTRDNAPPSPAKQKAKIETQPAMEPQPHPAMIAQRLKADPRALSPGEAMHLQRTIGNRAVGKLLSGAHKTPIQTKLTINELGDKYEQEADRVADQVMRMPEPVKPLNNTSSIQRQEEEEQETVQAKPLAAQITPLVQRETEAKAEEKEIAQTMLVQRQAEAEEKEPLQGIFLQRQTEEEEEPVQAKLLQRQGEEEEELAQAKPVQRQGEEDEDIQTKPLIQRQTEEEEETPVQPKPVTIQRLCPKCEKEGSEKEGGVQRAINTTPAITIRRLCPKCREKQQRNPGKWPLQLKPAKGTASQASPNIESNINAMKGGGNLLPKATRSFFENRFGADFSRVRVHTDNRAAETAKSINARAFTVGSNIAFGGGQYRPDTGSGKRLLAHELTHVVQQKPQGRNMSTSLARQFFHGQNATTSHIQRDEQSQEGTGKRQTTATVTWKWSNSNPNRDWVNLYAKIINTFKRTSLDSSYHGALTTAFHQPVSRFYSRNKEKIPHGELVTLKITVSYNPQTKTVGNTQITEINIPSSSGQTVTTGQRGRRRTEEHRRSGRGIARPETPKRRRASQTPSGNIKSWSVTVNMSWKEDYDYIKEFTHEVKDRVFKLLRSKGYHKDMESSLTQRMIQELWEVDISGKPGPFRKTHQAMELNLKTGNKFSLKITGSYDLREKEISDVRVVLAPSTPAKTRIKINSGLYAYQQPATRIGPATKSIEKWNASINAENRIKQYIDKNLITKGHHHFKFEITAGIKPQSITVRPIKSWGNFTPDGAKRVRDHSKLWNAAQHALKELAVPVGRQKGVIYSVIVGYEGGDWKVTWSKVTGEILTPGAQHSTRSETSKLGFILDQAGKANASRVRVDAIVTAASPGSRILSWRASGTSVKKKYATLSYRRLNKKDVIKFIKYKLDNPPPSSISYIYQFDTELSHGKTGWNLRSSKPIAEIRPKPKRQSPSVPLIVPEETVEDIVLEVQQSRMIVLHTAAQLIAEQDPTRLDNMLTAAIPGAAPLALAKAAKLARVAKLAKLKKLKMHQIKWKGMTKGKLKPHFDKHRADFGATTQKQYENLAKSFAGKTGSGIRERRIQNTIFKYEESTNTLLIANAKGRYIKTFYKPSNGVAGYFDAMRQHIQTLRKLRK